jgi:hypothetical protein
MKSEQSIDACQRRTVSTPVDRSLKVAKCRDLRKFYNLREPKEGEVITYDRWYYLTYGIIDGLNYESNLQTNPTQPHSRIS